MEPLGRRGLATALFDSPVAVVAVAVALFTAVFMLRLAVSEPEELASALYILPIGLLAMRFGLSAGLGSALFAVGLAAVWASTHATHIGALGYGTRAVAFLVVGVGLGHYADRLRQAQRNERELFENAPDGLVEVDGKGRITAVNPEAERLFGYTRGDLLGEPVEVLVPERLRHRHAGERSGYLAWPTTRQMGRELALTGRRKDGTEMPVEIALNPRQRPDGLSVTAVVRDISQRTAMQRELARWAHIFEHAEWGVVVKSANGHRIESANPAFALMHGSTVEELAGAPVTAIIPTEAMQQYVHHLLLTEERGRHSYETVHLRKDGSRFPVRVDATAVRDERREILYRAVQVEDITERTRTLDELRASEERYRALMEHAPEAVMVLDVEEQSFFQVNEEATRLLEYSRDELRKLGPADVSPPVQPDGRPSAEAAMEYLQVAIDGGTPVFEWLHRTASGRDVPCEVRLVRLPHRERVLIRGSSTDITERKRAERERAAAAIERQIAAKARDLQRITDTALAHQRLDQLLPELLGRVRDILLIDNAAVLLADETGRPRLRASHGVEATEVRAAVEESFAARVVDARRPLALYGDQLHAELAALTTTATQPPRALLGVPLNVESRVVGVLQVGALRERRFTDDETSLLQLAADRAALAIEHARLYERERQIATTLQHSLLPEHLPDIPGVTVSARYRPARQQVGGDFYDLFARGSQYFLVVGDVCGKGPDAAALTAQARHTLRAEARHTVHPSRLLCILNDTLADQRLEPVFLTAICATIDLHPGGATLTMSTGGHPPPLLLRADGRVQQVGDGGMLIGALPNLRFRDTTIELDAGDTLICYTDGLLEAHAPVQVLEADDLTPTLAAATTHDLGVVLERLERVAVGPDPDSARDDIALLAIRLDALPRAVRPARGPIPEQGGPVETPFN
ncbi:MAG: PAS domain S-box protein [Carbonactinosporaceae bacterium]